MGAYFVDLFHGIRGYVAIGRNRGADSYGFNLIKIMDHRTSHKPGM